MTRRVFTVVDPQTVPDSPLSMRSMSSVRAGSKDRKPCNRSGYYARWEGADNGVMSNHDDQDGGEADVAYEAVAQLTVPAGSGELDRGMNRPSKRRSTCRHSVE